MISWMGQLRLPCSVLLPVPKVISMLLSTPLTGKSCVPDEVLVFLVTIYAVLGPMFVLLSSKCSGMLAHLTPRTTLRANRVLPSRVLVYLTLAPVVYLRK